MTERIADPQAVCPFVALDEDRDHRAPGPDHHHRCFAESPAAPRALAHQAAYCLSGSFPACPTFVDWARREAAPVRVDPPIRSLRDTGSTRAAAAPPPPPPASRAGGTGGAWTAPPPWATAAAAGAAGSASAEGGPAGSPDAGDSAAHDDRLGAADEAAFEPGEAIPEGAATAAASAGVDENAPHPDDAPAFLVGRPPRPAPVPAWDDDDDAWRTAGDADAYPGDGDPVRIPIAAPRRMPVGYAPVAASKSSRRAGSTGRGRVDPAAPSWEEPRHFEEYPALKSRRGPGIPRLAVYALVVLLVGAGLFVAPALLRGLGDGGEQASPTPAASSSVAPSVAASPTPVPTPEQVVHTVKSGETLSGIAAIYGVTVEDILAANPSITDPNKIAPGDKVVIPQPLPSEIVSEEITPAP